MLGEMHVALLPLVRHCLAVHPCRFVHLVYNTSHIDVQVSTSGTLQLERRRPVDVLWAILEVRQTSEATRLCWCGT